MDREKILKYYLRETDIIRCEEDQENERVKKEEERECVNKSH